MAEEIVKPPDPKPWEIAKAKADNIDNTRALLLERLKESPPTEITITFNHLSFVIKPENLELRKLYTLVVKAIADQMVPEKEHHDKVSLKLKKAE